MSTSLSQPELRNRLDAAARHFNNGDLAAAERLCRAVLAALPAQPSALDLLGMIAHRAGDTAGAVGWFERAVAAAPQEAGLRVNLGVALLALGRPADALVPLERACALAPRLVDAWFNLGRARQDVGERDAAIAAYSKALALAPDDAEALNNYGALLTERGRAEEALPALERAVRLQPRYVAALLNLGEAFAAVGKLEDAIACSRRALALAPDNDGALLKLAHHLRLLGRLDDAEAAYRRAIEMRPPLASAWAGLAATLLALQRLAESEAASRQALMLAPADAKAHQELLVALNYRRDVTGARMRHEAQAWEAAHAAGFKQTWPAHANDRDPDRPLRIGFVSANFGAHPVGYFIVRLLEHLDRTRCATYCYHAGRSSGPPVPRCAAAATCWVDARDLDDEALAARVRADAIDILVDQDGHFSGNRLLVYARKPAPVQATWHGWPATTGLAAFDWFIVDPHHIPPDAEAEFVERIVRLPDGMVCYDPPEHAPPVTQLPSLGRDGVTFAAFHNPAKLDPDCVALWARVLAALPGSRIVFKYRGVDAPSTRARLARIFAAAGVDASRVAVEPPGPHAALLARYGDCDIALDAQPYSGSTTTCEALWMGVPVVTLPGTRMPGRHAFAHLMTVGLAELVARDADDYVAIAVGLARDPARLAQVRAGLRARMTASPLCDAPRFARNFAAVLRMMWRDWLARA
jgi:predicted O-linked N-acetylglucosamine transferase (SPINDLY family)